jgi:hypothetical protein
VAGKNAITIVPAILRQRFSARFRPVHLCRGEQLGGARFFYLLAPFIAVFLALIAISVIPFGPEVNIFGIRTWLQRWRWQQQRRPTPPAYPPVCSDSVPGSGQREKQSDTLCAASRGTCECVSIRSRSSRCYLIDKKSASLIE